MENVVAEIHRGQTENGERDRKWRERGCALQEQCCSERDDRQRDEQGAQEEADPALESADITILANYQNFSIKSACDLGSTL